ncbi:MAG: DUF4815 domain-containing protein [Sulfitobacter sp.]
MLFAEGRFLQGADLNELQGLFGRKTAALGNMVAANGNRISGAEITVALDIDADSPEVVPTTASLILASGQIYVGGNVLAVEPAQFDLVSIAGDVIVGVRKVIDYIDSDADETLLGLHAGAASELEPGAVRTEEKLAWAILNDGGSGEFSQVYQVSNGTVVDQTPPPALEGILETLSLYDRSRGNYIVAGSQVSALGEDGDGNQVYSIAAGSANVLGFRKTRETAFIFRQSQNPELELVSAEVHTYSSDGGSAVVTVTRPPIEAVISAVVTKRVTENVVRGSVPNGMDELQHASVIAIESVTQGATTFDPATYEKSGDNISWAAGGAEPDDSSTYSVTYTYFAPADSIAFDNSTITLTGGEDGEAVLVTYQSRIPRKDILCLDANGVPQIVEGVSARKGALSPSEPSGHLKLAEIHHDWFEAPSIVNNGVRVLTYDYISDMFALLLKVADQSNRTALQQSVPDAASVSADGWFTDSFLDDSYRDDGVAQSAAVIQGTLQLPVVQVFVEQFGGFEMLDYVEEVIISQPLATGDMKVNPYANFNPMPGDLKLNPNADFWTETQTEWTSPISREFTAAPDQSPESTTITEEVSQSTQEAAFLRQLDIDFALSGFGVNEELESLIFAGRDVTPAPSLIADANGQISGTIAIPADVPTGSHTVDALGSAGSFARATFVGEGEITTEVMRRVTLVTVTAPDPVTIVNVTNVTNVTNTVVTQSSSQSEGRGSEGSGTSGDPLAWTFVPPQDSFNCGINFEIAVVGEQSNGLRVQLATTLNGYPTNEVLADCYISMIGVAPGDTIQARWDAPVFTSASLKYCVVIMTDDADHAIKIATLGEVVPETQQRVASQPYTAGDLFSGSNRTTWVAHPDSDPKIEVVAAKFTQAEKSVLLFEGSVQAITDLLVRGAVELQTTDVGFRYELEREDGQRIPLAPGQSLEFSEYVSETIKLHAILTGTQWVSPMLYPGTTLVGGQLQTAAEYVSKVFPIEGDNFFRALYDRQLPAGASVSVDVDAADGNWTAVPVVSNRSLSGGWIEPKHQLAFVAPNGGRVKLTLTGTPAARPSIARLRVYSY